MSDLGPETPERRADVEPAPSVAHALRVLTRDRLVEAGLDESLIGKVVGVSYSREAGNGSHSLAAYIMYRSGKPNRVDVYSPVGIMAEGYQQLHGWHVLEVDGEGVEIGPSPSNGDYSEDIRLGLPRLLDPGEEQAFARQLLARGEQESLSVQLRLM